MGNLEFDVATALRGGAGSDRAVGGHFTSNPAPFPCSRCQHLISQARAAPAARNGLVRAMEDHNELVLYPEMEIH